MAPTPTERPGKMRVMLHRCPWLAAFATALLVAGVTRSFFPFDGLYGQDAFAYFRYAQALWPHLRTGAPLPVLYWPAGYPVTVALLLPLTRGGPFAGQMVSAFACAWAAAATSLLVRDLGRPKGEPRGDPWPALVAGLAVAMSGAVLRSSQVVMADALGLGATAAALVCLVRYAETARGPWLVGCLFALAWGTVTRWLVGFLVLPLGVFLAFHEWRHARAAGPGATVRRLWPWLPIAALVGLAVLVPQLVIAHSVPASLEKHEWLVGWSLRSAFARDFHTPEGHDVYRLPVALFYLVRLGWPDYFFPVHVPFVVTGAWSLVRDRRWPSAVLLLGWPATVWLFLSGIPYENPRFLLPTLPAIGALFGIGFAHVLRSTPAGARWVPTVMVAGALAAGLALGAREHARLVARKNADRDLVAWVSKLLPPDARLIMEGPTLAFQYYASISAPDLFTASTAEIDALVASGAPLFLLADVDQLKDRWVGIAPERHFEALRQGPGLTVVGTHPPFTLFRAGVGN
jgi:hypothetical protein